MKSKGFSIAKRASLFLVATGEQLLRRGNPRYDTEMEGAELSMRLMIVKLREQLGPWNTGFPTTLRLQNLQREINELASALKMPRERAIFSAVAKMCRILAITPSVHDAAAQLFELHAAMLEDCAAHMTPKEAYQAFVQKRCDEARRVVGAA